MWLILVAIAGLLFGSFANAAIYRIHAKKPLAGLKTRSICPHCKHQLAAIDLVPLLSWLWLRGRCRYCHKPISIQYPLVEAVMAALFVWSALAWQFDGLAAQLQFGFWLLLLVGLVILAVYDLRWMILPDRVMTPLLILAAVQLANLLFLGESRQLVERLIVAAVAGGFFYGLHALGKGRWMGGGDVKLAFLMGMILTVRDTVVALVLAFNLAAALSLGLILADRASRKSLIPFGPFLIAATIIAQLHGQQLTQLYLKLVSIY